VVGGFCLQRGQNGVVGTVRSMLPIAGGAFLPRERERVHGKRQANKGGLDLKAKAGVLESTRRPEHEGDETRRGRVIRIGRRDGKWNFRGGFKVSRRHLGVE